MKKWFRIMLVLCLVLTLLPAAVFAAAPTEVGTADELASALEKGGDITLTAPITNVDNIVIDGGKAVTLNLNGYDLTMNAGCVITVDGGSLNLTGTGNINGKKLTGNPALIRIYGSETDTANYSVVTIGEGVTVKMADAFGGAIFYATKESKAAYGAKLIVNGTIESLYGFSVNGMVTATDGTNIPEIRVNPTGKLTGSSAIYGAGYALYDIYGTLEGNGEFGIELRAGKLNVHDGATITCSAPFSNPVPNGNGSTVQGAAIAVSQHTTNLPIEVNILGGTITETGENGHALYEIDTNKTEPPENASKGVSVNVTGGTFNGPVFTTNKKMEVSGGNFSSIPAEYVVPGAAQAALTREENTRTLIGSTITATSYQAGDKLSILSGDARLSTIPGGVTVENKGDGNVSVNGFTVAEGDSLTVHTHSMSGEWLYDEDAHWQACEDPDCTEGLGYAQHTLEERIDLPTCTTEGKKTTFCSVCGYSVTQVVPVISHELTEVKEVPATETAQGVKAHWVCKNCDKLFADAEGKKEVTKADLAIPSLTHTHTLTEVKEVPATNTAEGVKAHWVCKDCGKLFADAEGKKEVTKADLVLSKLQPKPITPQTGDTTPVSMIVTLMVLSVVGIAVVLFVAFSYKGKYRKH